jgi:hypothetical protein
LDYQRQPAESFDPKAKPSKKAEKPLNPSKTAPTIQDHELEQMKKLIKQVEEEKARGDGQTTYQDKLKALLEKENDETQESKDDPGVLFGKKGKAGKKSKSDSDKPSWFWEWMVGIKFFSQLKSKVKKSQDLTMTEKWVVILYKIYKFIEPPFKHSGKFIGKLFIKAGKSIWDSIEKAIGKTAKGILDFVLPLILIGLLIWGILAFFHFAVVSPLHWLESKVKSGFHWGGSNDAEPTATQPVTSSIPPQIQAVVHKTAEKKIEKTTPTVAYQPAVSFQNTSSTNPTATLYDPKILELEIKSLPGNYVMVKDFPLTPDEGMPVDVAVSRMQNIADPDKYTMMIGSGKQIISSVNPTNTTLTIQYKSADPFGLFGGGNGVMNFLWEDVKYIHANEIETVRSSELGSSQLKTSNSSLLTSNSGDVIYQCSLVVSGSKYPLTIQCATAADLEHLVSTMQYFIRHSRLAHDTALGGMPYPNQGLRLNDECLVEVLWANSPADKAGVNLGDMVWSVDKNAQDQPDRKKLETQLGALTSGPHDLYIVSPKDRNAGLVQMNAANSNVFNPKRHKVVLTI